MPFYTYHCKRCDGVQDAYRHVSTRHDAPVCCETATGLCIVAPAVAPDLPGYESPTTGKWIEGKSARREDLRRSGCRPYESAAEERKEAARQRGYEEAKSDRSLKEAIAQTFYALPEAKRRQLTRG
jgi:hypothetical protein